jgi:hypothetical protein
MVFGGKAAQGTRYSQGSNGVAQTRPGRLLHYADTGHFILRLAHYVLPVLVPRCLPRRPLLTHSFAFQLQSKAGGL